MNHTVKSQGINNNRQCLFYLENKKVEHYGRRVEDMNKTVDIIRDKKDIVVVVNGKEVFRKPKTAQTVAIAHNIYMGYKYENDR